MNVWYLFNTLNATSFQCLKPSRYCRFSLVYSGQISSFSSAKQHRQHLTRPPLPNNAERVSHCQIRENFLTMELRNGITTPREEYGFFKAPFQPHPTTRIIITDIATLSPASKALSSTARQLQLLSLHYPQVIRRLHSKHQKRETKTQQSLSDIPVASHQERLLKK